MASKSTQDSNPNVTKDSGLTKSQQRRAREEAHRAAQAAQQRKAAIRRGILISGSVIAVIAIIAVLVVVGKNKANSSTAAGAPPIGQSKYGLTVGNPNAPHQLIIYEDFICPYCGALEHNSETEFDAAAAAGKVYIEYRPFNLLAQQSGNGDQWTLWALNAFYAVKDISGDSVALKFHNLLYQNQAPEGSNGNPGVDQIVGLANEVVPQDQQATVDAKINDTSSYKSTWEDATNEAINQAGVNSTPTVYFDGSIFSNQSGNATGNFAGMANMATNLMAAINAPAASTPASPAS